MTAEIAIINKTAIALAADSKVTLSIGGKQKTYDTVDKIFSLSKTHPVGAMIYGGAEFMGFPWETILKEYRRRSPRKCFDTVFDWADDLKSFLCAFFPFDDDDTASVIRHIGLDAIQQLFEEVQQIERTAGALTPEELESRLQETLAAVSEEDDFFTDTEWKVLIKKYDKVVDEISTKGLAKQMPADPKLLRLLVENVIRKCHSSRSHTGLVVAGFGEKELLPSLVTFEIDGIIEGKLKYKNLGDFDGTRNNRGAIIPFAQTDMVYRFMEGIDPSFSSVLQQAIHDITLQTALNTARAFIDDDAQFEAAVPAIEEATNSQVKSLVDSIGQYQRDSFSGPIIDMTMSLPKDELANLAESLVSLTSLQRKVSREIETVGGAIDVVVISKGDGLVWIKRKHYFNPDRNIRFVNAYFSEYEQANDGGTDDE